MKRQYISPAVNVHKVRIEANLLQTSPVTPTARINYGYDDESQSEGVDYAKPSEDYKIEKIYGEGFDVL